MHDMVETHLPLMAHRLDNWRRWCRVGKAVSPVRCGSIESRFIRTSDHEREMVQSRFVDRLDALVVERAMPLLAHRDRVLIKAHYVLRQPERASCRQLGIRLGAEDYRHAVYRAVLSLKNILDKMESRIYKSSHNPIPSSDVLCAQMGAQSRL